MVTSNYRACANIVLVIALVLLTGCSIIQTTTDKTIVLKNRVSDYMDARMKGDKENSYLFFSRESEKRIPREKYMSIPQTIAYVSYTIDTIDIADTGKEADVTVKVDIKIMTFVFKGITQTQQWLWESGTWCIDIKPVAGLPGSFKKKK